ncbi:hypothetical protein EGK75_08785 [Neisseria weixii]|uniref:Uncharacterized protein n=1 Tax=Neisseria weixii TaxID=1853276 RepID=A0A3N4MW25_9NEIS|nr:hypothetical protein CGZ65_06955 [Neisseria weixii]RPD85987.1 hypothetical protein EGK74_09025 [Neisseria weixii]RPD86725.1 hypothetical protein EGK75_08785 [Neisseria weixii]
MIVLGFSTNETFAQAVDLNKFEVGAAQKAQGLSESSSFRAAHNEEMHQRYGVFEGLSLKCKNKQAPACLF